MKLLPGPLRRRSNGDDEAKKTNGNGNGNGTTTGLREIKGPDKEGKEREKQANRERIKKEGLQAPIAAVAGLDESTAGRPFLRGFLYRKVPKDTNWYYTLGS